MSGRVIAVMCLSIGFGPWSVAWSAAPKSESRQYLSNKSWNSVPKTALTPRDIDELLATAVARSTASTSPIVSDEVFLRRVRLDLTGRLPSPTEIAEFVTDKSPEKRSRKIDQLLASDDYARHWANYWRDVFVSRVTDNARRALVPPFENWLTQQFAANRPWDEIARDILTAKGRLNLPRLRPGDGPAETEDSPAAFFLLAYPGSDGIYDRTNEAARIFLGLQIQCAQCHDHPYDGWKREQYHELAAFFGKLTDRPIFEVANERRRLVGFQLVSRPFGDHRMPDAEDPKKSYPVSLRFLDGTAHSTRSGDEPRRAFLADKITRDNYYFAAAFVNRMWGEFMGRAIVQPVDDLGPTRDGIESPILVRLAAGFKASGYDVKALLRVICNSEAYQRRAAEEFATAGGQPSAGLVPRRLNADALWQSLSDVLGPITRVNLGRFGARASNMMMNAAGLAARFGVEGQFKQEFRFDPSLPPDDVESTIPQALWLMNNSELHGRLRAESTTMLGRLLMDYPKDADAVAQLYLRVLARKPSDNERSKALNYIRRVNNRREAYEDLLWALINSTEFQTRR